MREIPPSVGRGAEVVCYEIRLEGRLDPRWAAWFDGWTVAPEGDGTTHLQGPVVDQAALFGLLQRVRDIGLPLISVHRLAPGIHSSNEPQ